MRPANRIPKRERGQSMVIAVVALMVLAIGMYTTYNLSRAVYEKIELQTAADAAAYSVATLEARSFNFIAFSNRAQVANYVQMLEAQSLLSNASFTLGLAGWIGDLAGSFAEWLRIPAIFSSALRALRRILKRVSESLERFYKANEQRLETMDRTVPLYIKAMTARNLGLTGVASMLALATATRVGEGAGDIVEANDPRARRNVVSWALNGYNVWSYARAFDFDALSPKRHDGVRRMMTELINASRYGSGNPNFVVSRGMFAELGEVMAALERAEQEGKRKSRKWLRVITRTFEKINNALGFFTGTSKMLSEVDGNVAELDDTKQTEFDRSDLTRGDAIVAKDVARFLPAGEFSSVISGVREGRHCYYEFPSNYGKWSRLPAILAGRDFKCDDDEHNRKHLWKSLIGDGGIQPFLKFNPSGRGGGLQAFNQPDVWIWLTKRDEDMGPADGAEDLRFEMKNRRERAQLDTRIGEDALDGINALARAQVYYHRPGAWNEPPNFFNPYWEARLAPKGPALDRLFGEISIPTGVAEFLSDNIQMH